MRRLPILLGALLGLASSALAQNFDFHPPASANAATANAIMRDLAVRVLPVYLDDHRERYLQHLAALQAVAGNYGSADDSRRQLRDRRRAADSAFDGAPAQADLFDIYVHARAVEESQHIPFATAFTQAFRDGVRQFGDHEARSLTTFQLPPTVALDAEMQDAFDRRRSQSSVNLTEAVDLISTFFAFEAYRSFRVLLPPLEREDEQHRYQVEEGATIKLAGGTSLTAVIVRPTSATKPLATLLEFTLGGATRDDAMDAASHGFVGIVAYVRDHPLDPGRSVPFQHEGDDARALIDWITKQKWSDGRVGLYGDRYGGYVAWAAARKAPAALKAIATADPMAPGVDFPMQGNIFHTAAYRWVHDATSPRSRLPGTSLSSAEDARWRVLDETWYKSGEPIGSLDEIYGEPNWIYHRLLNHPSFDLFWQLLLPTREQFAKLDVPVLTMTGYYADGAAGALYYINQLARNPAANQTIVLGPYGDAAIRQGPTPMLAGYGIDDAAKIDLRELRYQWFDNLLNDRPPPALLRGHVNYEVTEANQWRYAASIEAMSTGSLRLYLDASGNGELLEQQRGGDAFLRQTVDLADRSDAGWTPPVSMVASTLQAPNALVFVGKPLRQPLEVSGVASGLLDLMPDRQDLDLNLRLYELLPSGVYLPLYQPAFEFRASYARDRVHRRLLQAGVRQQLPFRAERVMSRKVSAGSRLVVVLGVNKRPDREVNFGSGKDVREETAAADGDPPLKIRWYGGSYVDLPTRKWEAAPKEPEKAPAPEKAAPERAAADKAAPKGGK